MAATTTIRVDTATHAELVALSDLSDTSLIETVRMATKALRRMHFAAQVSGELDALKSDPDAWAAYLAEGEQAVSDGIG